MIRNIWLVARREYIADVRTRSFLLGVLMTPALILAATTISDWIERAQRKAGKPFAIVDLSTPPVTEERQFEPPWPGSELGSRLAAGWQFGTRWAIAGVQRPRDGQAADALIDSLSARTRAGELEGFAVLRGDLVAGGGRMQWYTRNIANEDLKKQLASDLRTLVAGDRYRWHDVSGETLAAIQAPVLDELDVDVSGRSAGTEGARDAATFIPMIFVYALVIAFSAQAQTLLTSTIEEKSNRLVEVLLSSISPFELMAGKIMGLVGATFTLMAIWSAGGAYMVHHQGWQHVVPTPMFVWFLVWMVITIAFYSTFIAAVGSAVTELKEAQNLMVPIWLFIMVPILLMFFVGRNPDAWWVQVLTFVPFFTPFLMVNRLASLVPPSPIEIGLALVLMVLSCWGAAYLASRVFRIGILMYGKPATPRELWRWLRAA